MSEFLDRLLGLDHLSTGGEGVEFRFAHPLPAWAWILVAAACAAWAAWSYWRLLGSRPARTALAVCRTLLLVLVAVLIAGPQMVHQNERVERDWLVVMADRSASMTVADAPSLPPDARPVTREAELKRTLEGAAGTLAAISQDRNVLFLGFDAGVYDLPSRGGVVPELGAPAGRRTAIGQSLDQALRRVAGRPVAGVLVLSDGRSADQPSRAVLRQLEASRTPVFVVPLGSASPLVDLALSRVEAPTSAFVGDLVPVQVSLDRLGDGDAGGHVRLVDQATGEVLDQRPIPTPPPGTPPEAITLLARPEKPGEAVWTVQIVPDTPDLSAENNTQRVSIELVDRPIRVAYFDGYPRWEYRYLKNLIVREKSIRSAAMLLAADRRYIQEGSDPLGALPRSQADWNAIDVVVMGDVRPGLWSDEQLTQLRALVAERGGGLLWIAGPSFTPSAWRGTPLADLVPFTLGADGGSSESGGPRPWLGPVLLKPAPAAERFGVLRLGETPDRPWPDELAEPSLGWPLLRWAQRIDPGSLKPTAEVLALAQPDANAPEGPSPAPLVMTMRYGAGRVVYVATDETWRLRYGRGETFPERFWLPVLRLLARESLGRTGKPAILSVSPERALAGQQVQVTLRLVDQTLIERRPAGVTVRLIPQGQPGRAIEVTLRPTGDEEGATAVLSASWNAQEPGVYRVEGADALLAGLDLAARLEVSLPDDELRSPQTDHELLATLAQATGGTVLRPEQVPDLAGLLPNRQLRILGTPDVETLWDKPVAGVLLIVLLTLEWAGRRIIKLA
jgi:hypothetical protein